MTKKHKNTKKKQRLFQYERTLGSMNRLFGDLFRNFEGSFWGCSGLFVAAWERFWQEHWGKIRGESPSEVASETIHNTIG